MYACIRPENFMLLPAIELKYLNKIIKAKEMRKKIIITAIAIPILIILTSISVKCVNLYCARKEADRIYHNGLKLVFDKNNPFSPRAELDFYDSLIKLPMNKEQLLNVLWFKRLAL